MLPGPSAVVSMFETARFPVDLSNEHATGYHPKSFNACIKVPSCENSKIDSVSVFVTYTSPLLSLHRPCGSAKTFPGGGESSPIYVFDGKSYIWTSLVPESLTNKVFVYAQQSGLIGCVPVTFRGRMFSRGSTTEVRFDSACPAAGAS